MSKAFRRLKAIFARKNGNLGPSPSSPRRGGDPLEFIYNKPNALSPLPSGEGWGGAKNAYLLMRRYTILYRLTLCLAFLLSASCSRKDTRPLPEELTCAERLMWQAPDSALHVLQTMPVPPESQRLAHATWALLTAQAKYRLGLSQTDSLIHIACDYFHRHGDARQKAYTYNYMASISKELQRQEEAQHFYHLAAEEVECTDEHRLGYLIYSGLADLYAYQDLGEYALNMGNKAAVYARKCNDSAYISSAELLQARAYTVLDSLKEAVPHYKESLNFTQNLQSLGNISGELAGLYKQLTMPDSALYYVRRMIAINRKLGKRESAAGNTVISGIYKAAHMPDSAIYYTEKILNDKNASLSQTASAHQNLYLLYEAQKQYKEAADHCFRFCQSLDSLFRMNQSRALADIQAKYDYQNVLIEKNKIKVRSLTLLSIVLCVAVLSIYLFQRKLRQKERILHKVQEEARSKEIQIQSNESQIAYLQNCITELNKQIEASKESELLDLRDNLLLQIHQLEQTNQTLQQEVEAQRTAPSQIASEDRLEVERLRKRCKMLNAYLIQQTPVFRALTEGPVQNLSAEQWNELKEVLNLYYDQFAEKLEQTYQLSETDIEMCCLLKLKLPLARIASYLHIAPDSVKKKKARLKKDLEKKLGGWGTHSSFDSWLWDL